MTTDLQKLSTVRDWLATIAPPSNVQLESAWIADKVDYCDRAAVKFAGRPRWSMVAVALSVDPNFRQQVSHEGRLIDRGYCTPGRVRAVQAAVVAELDRLIAEHKPEAANAAS